jgi:hypothetical protein
VALVRLAEINAARQICAVRAPFTGRQYKHSAQPHAFLLFLTIFRAYSTIDFLKTFSSTGSQTNPLI